MERFWKRVLVLPFTEGEKLEILRKFLSGNKRGAEFGAFIRKVYSKRRLTQYGKRISPSKDWNGGFSDSFSAYMMQGFDLQKLCGICTI